MFTSQNRPQHGFRMTINTQRVHGQHARQGNDSTNDYMRRLAPHSMIVYKTSFCLLSVRDQKIESVVLLLKTKPISIRLNQTLFEPF